MIEEVTLTEIDKTAPPVSPTAAESLMAADPETPTTRMSKVIDLVKRNKYEEASKYIDADFDLLHMLSSISPSLRVELCLEATKDTCLNIFRHMQSEEQGVVIDIASREKVSHIFNGLSASERFDLFMNMPHSVCEEYLPLLPPADIDLIRKHLWYSRDSVGRYMNPACPSVSSSASIDEVLKMSAERHNSPIVFVVDTAAKNKLLGEILISNLITTMKNDGDSDRSISDMMTPCDKAFYSYDDCDDAVYYLRSHPDVGAVHVLPVINEDRCLVGYLTPTDVICFQYDSAQAAAQMASGIANIKTPYPLASPFLLFGKRAVWLVLLVVLNIGTSWAMMAYDEVLEHEIALRFVNDDVIDE